MKSNEKNQDNILSNDKNHTIQQQLHQQTIIHQQPFYLSIKVDSLYFTQGSNLSAIIDHCNQIIQKQEQLKSNPSFSIKSLKNSKKCVFLFQIFDVKKQTQQKIVQSYSIGQVHQVSSTNKLYEYPVYLTQINLQSKDQLCSFIYHFQSNLIKQFKLNISVQVTDKQKILIGQCRIDPNLFISIFIDDGIQCIKDSKKIVKIVENQRQISQQIQIQYQVYIERSRLHLQKIMSQKKKGIKVLDFKQHIRKILQERQLSQKEQMEEEKINELQQQYDLEQRKQKQHALQKSQTKTTLSRYLSYLSTDVQSQLHYVNPQKQVIDDQIRKILEEERKILQIQKNKRKKQKLKSSVSNQQQTQLKKKKTNLSQKDKKVNVNLPNIDNSSGYKWNTGDIYKMIGFVIVSSILLYYAMIPSSKIQ